MPYLVADLNEIRPSGDGDDREAIQNYLDGMEVEGYTLVQVLSQYDKWDGEGSRIGSSEVLFIFHKQPDSPARIIN